MIAAIRIVVTLRGGGRESDEKGNLRDDKDVYILSGEVVTWPPLILGIILGVILITWYTLNLCIFANKLHVIKISYTMKNFFN